MNISITNPFKKQPWYKRILKSKLFWGIFGSLSAAAAVVGGIILYRR